MSDPDHTSSPKSVKKSDFRLLLKEFSKRGVFVPRTFIDLTGDTQVASFLAQVMFWSDHTTDPEHWFFKSYKDWKAEIGLSKFQVSRCASKLKPFGLETKLKKAGKAPTVHYRIDFEIFETRYRQFLDSQETGKSRNLTIQAPSDSEVSRLSSFSIVDSQETEQSIYIEYIHRIQESFAEREKELLRRIEELEAKLAKFENPVFGSKEPQTIDSQPKAEVKATPKRKSNHSLEKNGHKPTRPKEVCDAIFDVFTGLYVPRGGKRDGLEGMIGRTIQFIEEIEPELTPEQAQSFVNWWQKDNPFAAKTKDKIKIQAAYGTWRNDKPKQVIYEIDENGVERMRVR